MMIQLNPPLPLVTPKGRALAHFLINEGIESHLLWVCFLQNSGECWTFANPDIRIEKNETLGRENISPFYDPRDVAFLSVEEDDKGWISVEDEEPSHQLIRILALHGGEPDVLISLKGQWVRFFDFCQRGPNGCYPITFKYWIPIPELPEEYT